MDASFKVTVNGEEKTVTMYYGLLDVICKICGDMEGVFFLAVDHSLREEALRALLSTRDKTGKITEEFNAFSADLSPEDAGELLAWAGDHALDFFVRSTERAQKSGKRVEPNLQALQPT